MQPPSFNLPECVDRVKYQIEGTDKRFVSKWPHGAVPRARDGALGLRGNTVIAEEPAVNDRISPQPPLSATPAGVHMRSHNTPQQQARSNRLSPVFDSLIRSVRIRSKSTSVDQQDAGNAAADGGTSKQAKGSRNILKRVLLKRHKAKHGPHFALRSRVDSTGATRGPPSIALLEGVLPPDAEYYVTVSGGDRNKLLTFHPKLDPDTIKILRPDEQRTTLNGPNAFHGDRISTGIADQSSQIIPFNTEVLCAKIAANPLLNMTTDAATTPANVQLDNVSKSKYFVSALNFKRDISNLSQLPTSRRGLPGVTHFIYKSPPLGAAVDMGFNQGILKLFGDHEIYSQFMKSHTCYQILPKSSMVVVFDSNLQIPKAFRVLFENSLRAAIIWDQSIRDYVGMVTVTDVIRRIRDNPGMNVIVSLSSESIGSLRNTRNEDRQPLLSIKVNDSLYEATRRLSECNVHRILVKDVLTGDGLYIITHKRLLRFLYLYIYELTRPSYLSMSIGEIRIGTFDTIHTVYPEDLVMRGLNIFLDHDVSAVPVIDSDTKCILDVYCKCDVIYLLGYDGLDISKITIREALDRRQKFERFRTFTVDDLLLTVIDRLVETGVHRLIGVDSNYRVIGIISLSDILCFLVLHAPRHDKSHRG